MQKNWGLLPLLSTPHSLTENVSRLVTESSAEKERKSANIALSATVPTRYFRELMNRRITF